MAKKGFEVSGRMSVDKFENLFLQSFGVYCDILTEDNKLAKQTDTLAVLRPEDFKGPKKIDFSLTANMLVENVIKKFEANFGISLQIYEVSKASNKCTLAALRREVILEVNDDGIKEKKLALEAKIEDLGSSMLNTFNENLPSGEPNEFQSNLINKMMAAQSEEDAEENSEKVSDVKDDAVNVSENNNLENFEDAEDNFYPPA
jgi:hypothetical protein